MTDSNDDSKLNGGEIDIKRKRKRKKKHKHHDNHKNKLKDDPKDPSVPTPTTKSFLSHLKLYHHKTNIKNDSIISQHEHHTGEDGGEYELEFPVSERKGLFDSMKLKISNFFDSFFPSKQQLHDKRLQNRMKVCVLAIALMWATSLKVAVYISTEAIEVPSAQTLYRSCKSAFEVTVEEQAKYSNCIKVQLDQCKNDFNKSDTSIVIKQWSHSYY